MTKQTIYKQRGGNYVPKAVFHLKKKKNVTSHTALLPRVSNKAQRLSPLLKA